MNDKEFYAVFVKSSYYVEGDERSRTNPGHGYPEHDVKYTGVIEFKSIDELKAWIVTNSSSYSPKQYRAIEFSTLAIKTRVEVEIE